MSGVDDRIVSMQFDNATFERKLSETIRSLDKLRQSLDFANSTRGMNDLSTAARNFDMSPMGSAVEGISAKFLALSTIAITALSTITSHAISAGTRIVNSLTLDPVLDGFREYETNMNSIQTILANTDAQGTTLEQVNAALDQLNHYSDQTIYNFSQMARNIGTFTAAGVDLDTSVNAIKGIANLAAISGSNSEQASTAMYQLSQAIATGTVKLMDWNSVVNAGMGGEVFQRALFESGKAMQTIANVPMDMTFDEWTAAGNSFRGSLQDGWLTAEVLTNTLAGFTGDLTEAQILAMGYTREQAQEIMRLGEIGRAAATEVKTFTQLISTVKESIASGWSQSFRTILGDFEEAKGLFTNINNAIGEMVSNSADARNQLLEGWAAFGGRDILIWGFTNAIQALSQVLTPIKDAFRDIFPRMTVERLIELTQGFAEFTERLKISSETADGIRSIFRGFFAALEIGWEIIKGIVGVIGDLFGALSGVGSGIFDFAANTGDTLTSLNEALVAGGGIRDFFERLGEVIRRPIEFLTNLANAIRDFFETNAEGEGAVGRVTERFEHLSGVAERLGAAWNWVTRQFEGVMQILDVVWDYISNWFSELGSRIADSFGPGDFDAAVDIVNVGLLGGIALLLRRFLSDGISINFGEGLIENIRNAFDGLTETLGAMQASLQATALMRIAIAVGVLTAAIVVLSMINSGELTRALTAISVGFAQLVGVMAALNAMNMGTGVIRISGLAAGLILVAGAAVILSVAIKNLSELGWEELARGLVGVAGALAVLVGATRLLAADTTGMVRAGVAMIGMSVALIILSRAVKEFAEMSWEEMAQGLVGVGVGLGLVTAALNFMPPGMAATGVGLVLISAGLLLLVEVVERFADIPWGDMAQGMTGLGVGLGLIAGAMHLMPPGLPATATGLLILSAALLVITEAVENMGAIPFGDMAKGIGGLAVMLAALAGALILMTGTAAGAGSLLVASGALLVLTHVIKELGNLSIGQIVAGIAAMAAVLALLGGAALLLGPLAPQLLAVGAAMALVGAAFALFGAGAMLVAKAFELMARAGRAGAEAIVDSIEIFIDALPLFIATLARAVIDFANEILQAAPLLIENIKIVLSHLLRTVIELVPEIAEALSTIITAAIDLISEHYPELQNLGYQILITFMQGVRDNIAEIATLGVDIIENLANSLIQNMPRIVEIGVNVITSFLTALAERAEELVAAGLQVLTSFLLGISNNIGQVIEAATTIITTLLTKIGESLVDIVTAGYNVLISLMRGISDNIQLVIDTAVNIVTQFINTLSENAQRIVAAGLQALIDLLSGIGDNINRVVTTAGDVVTSFITTIADKAVDIANAGANALIEFIKGVARNVTKVVETAVDIVVAFISGIDDNALRVVEAGADMIIDFMNGLADTIREKSAEFREAGRNIADAIIDGMLGGIRSGAGGVLDAITSIPTNGIGIARSILGINSPSKVFYAIGESIPLGMSLALNRDTSAQKSAGNLAERTIESFRQSFGRIEDSVGGIGDISPVITPVLDLTKVQQASRSLDQMMAISAIVPEVSYARARTIATTTELAGTEAEPQEPVAPTEITFEQNIYSPTALSTNDIYRNTKSQIALAKEELSIP